MPRLTTLSITDQHLFNVEESLVNPCLLVCSRRVVSFEQLEFELQSSVRREGSSHREQVDRYSEHAQRQGDDVDGVGQRGVETVGVALGTGERFPLTPDADHKQYVIIIITSIIIIIITS